MKNKLTQNLLPPAPKPSSTPKNRRTASARPGIYPSSNPLLIKLKKGERITTIKVSPKGRKVAFVSNEMGKCRNVEYN